MKRRLLAAAVLAACLPAGDVLAFAPQTASTAQPQTTAGRPQKRRARVAKRFAQRLERVDKNGDGVISRDEWPARRSRAFDRIDTNHDGVVSADELRAVTAARLKHRRR